MLSRLILAPFTLLRNLLALIPFLWSSLWFNIGRAFRKNAKTYVELTLPKEYPLGRRPARGLSRLFNEESGSMLELREQLEQAATIKELDGIIIYVEDVGLGQARVRDLLGWIDRVREAGKHVIMHTDSAGLKELVLLSAATDTLMTPAGRLYAFGLRFEDLFLAPLFDKLGIEPQFVHIGAFKTATHRFHKSEQTLAQSLMMRNLHAGLTESITSRIATRAGLEPDALREILSRSPLDGQRARVANLVQGQSFRGEVKGWLRQHLAERAGQEVGEGAEAVAPEDINLQVYELEPYLEAHPKLKWRPFFKRSRYVAVLDLTGNIVQGKGGPGGGGAAVDPDEVIPALERLKQDRRCAGVLLHINSPGGSALASDLMWRQIEALRAKKPVVAYCSDVAASGGYYLAVAADEIICRPETITGSIGVITGKFSASGALKQLNIPTSAIYDDESSAFMSVFEPLPERVMLQLRDDARTFYRRFLDRVGQARHIERRRLHRFARGRVYLGQDAYDRGLVDGLGGLEMAIDRLYSRAELRREDAPLRFVAHRKQNLRQLVSGSLLTVQERALLKKAQAPLQTLTLLKDNEVLALMPLELKLGEPR